MKDFNHSLYVLVIILIFRLNASTVVVVKLIHPVVFVAIVHVHISSLAQDVKNIKVQIGSTKSKTLMVTVELLYSIPVFIVIYCDLLYSSLLR